MFQSPHFYQVRIRGLQGNQGEKGETGAPGSPGVGVPAAGSPGQVLRKASGSDYDTEWFTPGALANGNDAGDVPVTPAGNIASTDVQSALQELDTEKAAAGHNHDGSYQPLDADLTALAALASTGVLVRSAADTYSLRSVAGTANQISVANGDGVAGNPTVSAVVASQAQAEAGTDNTSLMTALRTAQAIAALAGASGGLIPIERKNSSSVASYDFVTGIDSTYRTYMLVGWLRPATDDVELWLRISRDAGSTWQSDAGDYGYRGIANDTGGTSRNNNSASNTKISFGTTDASNSVGNASDEKISFCIRFDYPNENQYHLFHAEVSWLNPSTTLVGGNASGVNRESLAFNGVRLLFESGNIAAGDVTLYGLKNS